jgi:hypothetical protein
MSIGDQRLVINDSLLIGDWSLGDLSAIGGLMVTSRLNHQ